MSKSWLCLCIVLCAVAAVHGIMDLVLVNDAIAKGAVCLDGTAPGYFYRKGSGSNANNWVLFFQGGGWCYTLLDCYERSKTSLGSSKFWGKTLTGEAVMSENPAINPDFYNWNVAYFQYCDGASFSGQSTNTIIYNSTTLYFRGKLVLNALLDDLILNRGLKTAGSVLLSGCSAGGLATYFHADFVGQYLKQYTSVQTYKASPVSGYFRDLPNLYGDWVYPVEMINVFYMQNTSGGINQDCIANTPLSSQFNCIFAEFTYPFIKTPFFILNSAYDSWQMAEILGVYIPSWIDCAIHGPNSCASDQIVAANTYHTQLIDSVKASSSYSNPQNGVFLHSCWSHCAGAINGGWTGIKVNGKSLGQAVGDWYFGRSASNNYIDCALSPTKPYNCNPTC